nr:hypothetical protein [Crocosphaera watsonii]
MVYLLYPLIFNINLFDFTPMLLLFLRFCGQF